MTLFLALPREQLPARQEIFVAKLGRKFRLFSLTMQRYKFFRGLPNNIAKKARKKHAHKQYIENCNLDTEYRIQFLFRVHILLSQFYSIIIYIIYIIIIIYIIYIIIKIFYISCMLLLCYSPPMQKNNCILYSVSSSEVACLLMCLFPNIIFIIRFFFVSLQRVNKWGMGLMLLIMTITLMAQRCQ